MTNQIAIDFVKKMEGFKSKSYQCSAGKWTNGYGFTRYLDGRPVKEGQEISQEDANKQLCIYLEAIEKDIQDLLDEVKLNENQMAAIMSFVYNVGLSNFASSTLLVRLHTQAFDKAADELLRWIYITDPKTKKKVVCNGLVTRRNDERELFLK